MKPAFSLLELIFAIVVLGIIVSVAVPKFRSEERRVGKEC